MEASRAWFCAVKPDASFLVVIPTIRQDWREFEPTMARIQASFTLPTDLHILDGSSGKPAALNRAHEELLLPSHATYYVTLDDDIVPLPGWQEGMHAAMLEFPELGAASLYYGESDEHQRLMGAERLSAPETRGQSTVRFCKPGHHLAGGNITFRREMALKVGPMPLQGHRYVLWEDAWRGRRVVAAGGKLGYVLGHGVEMVEFVEPEEYRKEKIEGIALSRQNQREMLDSTGVKDPLLIRIRRRVAKLRGRGDGF